MSIYGLYGMHLIFLRYVCIYIKECILEVSHIFLGAVESRPFQFGRSPKPRLAIVSRKSIYEKCAPVASALRIPLKCNENAVKLRSCFVLIQIKYIRVILCMKYAHCVRKSFIHSKFLKQELVRFQIFLVVNIYFVFLYECVYF